MNPEVKPSDNNPLSGPACLPRVAMPLRLVLIRHGESEANLVSRAVKRGSLPGFPQKFIETPDREFRLSALGREQALLTGPWLARQYPRGFDVIYASDHIRARETAALVCKSAGWEKALIRIDPQLGERPWGRFAELEKSEREEILALRRRDPLHAPMPEGELLLQTRLRTRLLLERAAREFGGQRVLVFSHGEYIEAIWAETAHMTTEEQARFFEDEAGKIRNCQVVEFSSEDPENTQSDGKLRWVRSSCPSNGGDGDWRAITPRRFTPDELLRLVESYPHLDF